MHASLGSAFVEDAEPVNKMAQGKNCVCNVQNGYQ